MFEEAYRAMNEQIVPEKALVTHTHAQMKALLDQQKIHTRPVLSRKIVLAVIVALALLGATAFALTQSIFVDWSGQQVILEEPQPAMTQHDLTAMQEKAQIAREMLLQAPDNELWVAEIWEETQITHNVKTAFEELKQMAERVKSSDMELLVPSYFPAGYSFVKGEMTYYTSAETRAAGLQMISEETKDGILLKKFRVLGPYELDIESYAMLFSDNLGNRLAIHCERQESSSTHSFTIGEGGSSQTVEVKGMAEGIYIHDEDNPFSPSSIYLRKKEMSPKEYYELPIPLTYSTMDDKPPVSYTYDAAVYDIQSDSLDKDMLMSIAESFQ